MKLWRRGTMRRGERGQNLVEFAVVTMFLLIPMLVGIADIGRAFNAYMVITNAAREGARAASRLPCYSTNATQRGVYRSRIIQTARAEVAGSAVAAADVSVTITPDPVSSGCQNAGQPVTVTTSTPFTVLIGSFIGLSDFTLQSTSAMARIEDTPEF
jgi:Flp pilus assembly protein TadG